jgi:transcriptional regulator with XRE-family HTH domain
VPRAAVPKTRRRSSARIAPETAALLKRLGERCRELRAKAGLTQQTAAERAGIAATHLQVVERGTTNPTVAILAALARAYGVTLAQMFKGV